MCPVYDQQPYVDHDFVGYHHDQPKRDNYETMYFVDDDVTAYKTCNATSMEDFLSLLLVFLCSVNLQT